MALEDDLFATERALASGGADEYRAHLTPDAVVIVPGMALDRDATIEGMAASPGWDEISMHDERLTMLAPGAALIDYRFTGRRGEVTYEALMGSVYVERDGRWLMAHHQQTPLA